MSSTDPTKKKGGGVNASAREGYAVPASYKTAVMLLIYTIKSCKGEGLASDSGKNKSM